MKVFIALLLGLLGCAPAFGQSSIYQQNQFLGGPISGSGFPAPRQPVIADISGFGTGVATALGINVGLFGSFVAMNGVLGTPSTGVATNLTGLPISTGVSGLGTGVATALGINLGLTGSVSTNIAVSTISANTLLDATFGTVLCNAAGGAITVTLPALAQKTYFIKKIDSSINPCTVVASSGNIDNLPSVTITSRFTSYQFQNDGSQWWMP